jgi:periplasmic copper chaperone A
MLLRQVLETFMQPFAPFAKLSLKAMLGVFTLLLIAACSPAASDSQKQAASLSLDDQNRVTITDAWMRPGKKDRMSAAYFTLKNSDTDRILAGVSSAAAENVELHQSYQEDGKSKMRHVGQLPIAAGESVSLAPGGLHIMLIKLHEDLNEGDEVTLVLEFQNGETLPIIAPVKAP